MDPITAFAMAQAAIGAIRKGVAFYKEAKQAGKEVMDVAHEVSGHIGRFMDAADVVKTAAEEQRKVVPKKGQGLNSKALDNVLRAKQVQMAEEELREMLVYQRMPDEDYEFEEVVSIEGTDYFLYINYGLTDDGYYEFYSEIIDEDELEEIMSIGGEDYEEE